jgi:hypothetical protein
VNDPIVNEVRRIRDAHAVRFNYDLDAIFQDIKERERKSGLKFVQGVAQSFGDKAEETADHAKAD